jgi:hypothetical protein
MLPAQEPGRNDGAGRTITKIQPPAAEPKGWRRNVQSWNCKRRDSGDEHQGRATRDRGRDSHGDQQQSGQKRPEHATQRMAGLLQPDRVRQSRSGNKLRQYCRLWWLHERPGHRVGADEGPQTVLTYVLLAGYLMAVGLAARQLVLTALLRQNLAGCIRM